MKMKLFAVMIFVLVLTVPAFAQTTVDGNNDNLQQSSPGAILNTGNNNTINGGTTVSGGVTATGGNATATGGNAYSGSYSGVNNSGNSSSTSSATGGSVTNSGNSTVNNTFKPTNTNLNMNQDVNVNTFTPTNTVTNTNEQKQSQDQKQKQSQDQKQKQSIENSGNSNQGQSQFGYVNIENPRAFVNAPGTSGTEQDLFHGKVYDVTSMIPVPALIGFKPYNGEGWVDVFTVEGWSFGLIQDRIRTGDLLQHLLEARQMAVDKKWNIEAVRYKVYAVDAAKAYSTSGAGAASGALNGGTGGGAGTIGIFPGASYGEASPRYIIWVLKTDQEAKKVSEGWKRADEALLSSNIQSGK